jgi:L-ascorbate metabolism protein UlaG (beta-lactamase superfamily)
LQVTWLGCAGFAIEAGGRTLLVDPFASRAALHRVALFPVEPDRAAIDRWIPRADYVICGHAHYDHALDAPTIARRDGARLIGSRTLALIAAAAGVPERQIVSVPPEGATLDLPPFTVRLVPSAHGGWALGRSLFCGCLDAPPRLPMRVSGWVDGGVFGIHVSDGSASLYHAGSAGVVDAALQGLRADVVLACLAGRRHTPGYLERLARHLRPREMVACHFDDFFRPLDRPLRA